MRLELERVRIWYKRYVSPFIFDVVTAVETEVDVDIIGVLVLVLVLV